MTTRKRPRDATSSSAPPSAVEVPPEQSGSAEHYDMDGPLLGAGAFGKVKLIKHRGTSSTFACKLMPKADVSMDDAVNEEVIMGAAGRHAHIISLVDAFELPGA
eukprot:3481655-Prymnesium_polylepis.1